MKNSKTLRKVLCLLAATVMVVGLAAVFSGCGEQRSSWGWRNFSSDYADFRYVAYAGETNSYAYYIVADYDEGCLYLYKTWDGSLCPLVHADGTPKLLQEYDPNYTPKNEN